MGTTTNRAYPYPESTDPPQGDAQIQSLAEAVDTDVAGLPILQAKKAVITAEQSRTNTAYGYLGTEDKVTGIVLPTDGLIVVGYQAQMKLVGGGGGDFPYAALFIGANQLKVQGSSGPAVQEVPITTDQTTYHPISSTPYGLSQLGTTTGSDVTTGQAVASAAAADRAGVCHIFAAAGTYDVGVQFKATAGAVTVKERKLWVYTIAFD